MMLTLGETSANAQNSGFYTKTACCLIDSSSALMYMGVPGGTHVVPGCVYRSSSTYVHMWCLDVHIGQVLHI